MSNSDPSEWTTTEMTAAMREFQEQLDNTIAHKIAHVEHQLLCARVRGGNCKITPQMLAKVTNPQWKQELVEAICLSKVR